jgi:hypothetical protein
MELIAKFQIGTDRNEGSKSTDDLSHCRPRGAIDAVLVGCGKRRAVACRCQGPCNVEHFMLRTSSALKLGKSRRLAREVRNNPQSMYQSRCQCAGMPAADRARAVRGAPTPGATAGAGRRDGAASAEDSAESKTTGAA